MTSFTNGKKTIAFYVTATQKEEDARKEDDDAKEQPKEIKKTKRMEKVYVKNDVIKIKTEDFSLA